MKSEGFAHRMRRALVGIIALLTMSALLLSGCSPLVEDDVEPLTLYATFYPIYSLASMLTEDVPDLTLRCLVQPQDGCLRDYSLSDWDLYLLAYGANGILAGGCGLEGFADTLQLIQQANVGLAEVLYGLDLYEGDIASTSEASHFDGENPHLYMSIKGAKEILGSLAGALVEMDTRYAEIYNANFLTATRALDSLESEVQQIVSNCVGQQVVIMNEALVYVAQDYGLEIADWYERESGVDLYDVELDNCLKSLSASGAKVVLIEKQAPKSLVDALETAGYAVAKVDILSTHSENESTEVYFEAQRANAHEVAQACSRANNGGL